MTKRKMDQIASVKARLLNVAKASYLTFESVLRRYFQERLLYRLSVSEYGDYFILKGGVNNKGAFLAVPQRTLIS